MKRNGLLTAACLVLAAVSVVFAPTASAAGGELAGTWTSLDTDASTQTLQITGSGNQAYAMVYEDDSATGACNGAPARITGPGLVDGDGVVMTATLVCLPGGNVFRSRLVIGFVHDTSSDTLTDSFGIVWDRVA